MSSRDPRVDPQPGDVLRRVICNTVQDYRVAYVFPDGSLAVAVEETYPDDGWAPEYEARRYDLAAWGRHVATASVLHVAEEVPGAHE